MISWKRFVAKNLNIWRDMAPRDVIVERIQSGATLTGTNMVILVLAMVVASIGLNVNSTAVVIGAMLISPLMGVIMGTAYGFVTYDGAYTKRTLLRWLFQSVFCIVASTIYFYISPIDTPSTELIARTSPTIWDVLIAIFGGLAGIIGQTREEKSNVIPGVAIATALMPPLCTAGFGLANHMYHFFFGALYLYFINCFFICVTSVIVLKVLRFPARSFASETKLKYQRTLFWIVGLLVIIPSLWASYLTVMGQIEEIQVKQFIAQEFNSDPTRQVVKYRADEDGKVLYLTLVGSELKPADIKRLNDQINGFRHLKGYTVKVVQSRGGLTSQDLSEAIKAQMGNVTKDLALDGSKTIAMDSPDFQKYKKAYTIESHKQAVIDRLNDLGPTLFPQIVKVSGGLVSGDDGDQADNYAFAAMVEVSQPVSPQDAVRIRAWIEKETGMPVILSIVKSKSDASKMIYGNGIAWGE